MGRYINTIISQSNGNLSAAVIAGLLLVVSVIFYSPMIANATKVVVAKDFNGGCAAELSNAAYAFSLDNACQTLDLSVFGEDSGNASFKYSCSDAIFTTFISNVDCNSSLASEVIPRNFSDCVNDQKFECAELPDDKLVDLQVGICLDGQLTAVAFEILLVLNTCVPVDETLDALFGGDFYTATINADKTITYTTFTDAVCSQGKAFGIAGKLDDDCVAFPDSPSSAGFAFATAIAGANVGASTSSALEANLDFVISILVGVYIVSSA